MLPIYLCRNNIVLDLPSKETIKVASIFFSPFPPPLSFLFLLAGMLIEISLIFPCNNMESLLLNF